jgi:hypothetical protein
MVLNRFAYLPILIVIMGGSSPNFGAYCHADEIYSKCLRVLNMIHICFFIYTTILINRKFFIDESKLPPEHRMPEKDQSGKPVKSYTH